MWKFFEGREVKMDFGSVLDSWDKMAGSGGGKDAKPVPESGAAQPGVPAEVKIDMMTAWLRTHAVYDKDSEDGSVVSEARKRAERRRWLLRKQPDAVLDLHGKVRDEAWLALDSFFESARRQGLDKLLVIHGKGNHSATEGVLDKTVRTFIEQCPFAGESGRSGGAQGGSGSTWVLLK
jgi:DNA-nicking Smr family endonuclease